MAIEAPTSSATGVRWDLSDLFSGPDDPRLAADLERVTQDAAAFAAAYRGKIETDNGPSAETLLAALKSLGSLEDLSARIGYFAHLAFEADTQDNEIRNLLQRVEQRLTQVENTTLFFRLEWQAVAEDAAKLLIADPRLAEYAHYLRVLRLMRPHTLTEPEEQVVNEKDVTGVRAWQRLFAEQTGALVIPVERDGKTESMPLDAALTLMRDPDRDTRKAAHDSIYAELARQEQMRAYIYDTIIQDRLTMDRLRHFADPMAERHMANEIEPEAVAQMLDVVEANYPLAHEYWRLKERLLGIDRLTIYDQYAPLPQASRSLPFTDGKTIVLEALGRFAPRFADIAARFFDRNWIDAEVRAGKRGGAFCAGVTPSLHPYILCNYTDTQRDALTVAHELGHGIHDVLSGERQNIFNFYPSLPVAETASVFAEMTVFDYLVERQATPADQLALLAGTIEDIFATAFRQTVLTRYEQKAYAARATDRLTPEMLKTFWWDANAPYYGDALQMTDGYRWGWSYIPHFINTRFYTYAYVFGELLVLALYGMYREQGQAFVPGYIELLSRGGSAAPADLVKQLGIDFRDKAFWQKGFDELARLVHWATRLADEVAA
ncbi:MAG: M3 family oligoendopeptidase [Anaerolineae bacterium]